MPDALDILTSQVPVPDAPVQAHSFKESDVLERYKDGFGAKEEPTPEPEIVPETPPAATPDAKAEADPIPPELLGIEPKKEEDELTKLLAEEPKGHIKNEHFKKVQTLAAARIQAAQAEKDQLAKELAEVKGRLNEDFIPEKVRKQLEDYQVRLKEREEELGRIAVERSPAFKEKFTNRKTSLVNQLTKTAEDLGLDKSVAKQLIHADLKKRVEILDNLELSASGQSYLTSLIQQHDQVDQDEQSFLADWQTQKARMEEEEMTQSTAQKARMKEEEDRDFQKVLDEMGKSFAPIRKVEGNDAWNKQVDSIIERAKHFYDGNFSNREFAEIVVAGCGAQQLGAINARLIETNRALAEENASLKAAGPSVPPVGSKAPVQDDSKLSFEERAKRTFDLMVGSAANNGNR